MEALSSTIVSPSLPEFQFCPSDHLESRGGEHGCVDLLQRIRAMRDVEERYYSPLRRPRVKHAFYPDIKTIKDDTDMMDSVSSFGSNPIPSCISASSCNSAPSEEKIRYSDSPVSDDRMVFVRRITNDSSYRDTEAVEPQDRRESAVFPVQDSTPPSPRSSASVSRWRPKIGQWMYKVLDYFKIRREVGSVAMSYLDRVVVATQRDGGITSRKANNVPTCLSLRWYQCSAMACLVLASKVYAESDSRIIPLNTMIVLGRGHIAKSQLQHMEHYILWALQWHVHPPTAQDFTRSMVDLLPGTILSEVNVNVKKEVLEMSYFLAELSALDEAMFMSYRASTISLASLWVSLNTYKVAATVWEEVYLLISNHAEVEIDPDEMDAVCEALEFLEH